MIITSTVEATPYTSRWFQTQNGLHSAPNLKVPLVMYEFVINKKIICKVTLTVSTHTRITTRISKIGYVVTNRCHQFSKTINCSSVCFECGLFDD